MAAIPFQIEVVEPAMGFVMARQLERRRFRVGPETKLGGVAVAAAAQPLAKDPDTAMRDDLYMFRLRNREDAARLRAGQLVELVEYRD